jgi:hypothetical protein
MLRRASLFFVLASLLVADCSPFPDINSNNTFNIVRAVNFPISNTISGGTDTSISVATSIDTLNDYGQYQTSAYLLRSSTVTRISLHSSDESFALDNLIYARILIGADTIAFDSIPPFTGATYVMSGLTGTDVTPYLRDTSFTSTLQFKLAKAPSNPVTVTATMTIVHTALIPVSK